MICGLARATVRAAMVASVLAAAACADVEPTHLTNSAESSASSALAATPQAAAEQVARALALAMQQPGVRAQVLQAMRRSPFVEHKLVLQEFVATKAGQHVLRAAAAAAGTTPAALLTSINSLPALDFYVPAREHRRAWKGTENVAVAASLGEDRSELSGFNTAGQVVKHSARSSKATGSQVLFLLHPAEPKGRRIGAQRDVAGSVIEDEGDGEIGVQLIEYLANGDSVVTDLASAGTPTAQRAGVQPARSLFAAAAVPDSTYLAGLGTLGMCDNNNCSEGNAIEFKAREKNASGTTLSNRTLRLTGIPSTSDRLYVFGEHLQIATTVNGYDGRKIEIEILETDDGFWNSDDRLDPRPVLTGPEHKNYIWAVGDYRDPFKYYPYCENTTLRCSEMRVQWTW